MHEHELAAPDGTVTAQSRTIERDTDHRIALPVFGYAGCDMGMMMLDRDTVANRERCGQLVAQASRCILGVQVVREHDGRDASGADHLLDRVAKGLAGCHGVEVADVWRDDGLSAGSQADRVLEMAAEREDGLRGRRAERDRP